MTTFCNIDQPNRHVEIGHTWLGVEAQRTVVNTAAKLLLLAHAFEVCDAIAVELRTHWHNRQSRAAIARLGAKQDGVLRNHRLGAGRHAARHRRLLDPPARVAGRQGSACRSASPGGDQGHGLPFAAVPALPPFRRVWGAFPPLGRTSAPRRSGSAPQTLGCILERLLPWFGGPQGVSRRTGLFGSVITHRTTHSHVWMPDCSSSATTTCST